LFVISRNSALTYKGKAVKVQEISKELGVRYVLEGSVRKAAHHVRITAQFIDATTDYHLWSERYDRPLIDIFVLQDEIVQKIVTTLNLQLTAWEKGYLVRKCTNNLEAYDLLLRGTEAFFRAVYETKKEANVQARQLFAQAIALDPQYAEAYAYLGWSYWGDWLWGWQREPQTMERALTLAQKALTLDDAQAAARRLLASIYLWQKQHERAIAEGERALAVDPNWTNAYMELGITRAFAGQPEEAVGLIEQAMRRNPREPFLYLSALGFAYRVAGHCEQALIPLERALIFNPNFLPARYNLATCYAELNCLEEAQAEAKEVERISPHFSVEHQRQVLPFKDPAALERTLAGLRKAGLK
jgi:adenylate cyclase